MKNIHQFAANPFLFHILFTLRKLKSDKLHSRIDSVQIYSMLLPKLTWCYSVQRTFNEIYAINLISPKKLKLFLLRLQLNYLIDAYVVILQFKINQNWKGCYAFSIFCSRFKWKNSKCSDINYHFVMIVFIFILVTTFTLVICAFPLLFR